MAMTLVRRPPNAPPLFGGTTVILLGPFDKEGMRRWQRLRIQKTDSVDSANSGGEAEIHGQDGDD